ncbi:hypothetical protein [Methanocella sp. MCL-LM]|uniref:hypothetical protein n=1 Tax=Methanocella sp. MCL-LM TaxID=3412035 RepID=UPI003C7078BE
MTTTEEIATMTQEEILDHAHELAMLERLDRQGPMVSAHGSEGNEFDPDTDPDYYFKKLLVTLHYPGMALGKGGHALDALDISEGAKQFLVNAFTRTRSRDHLFFHLKTLGDARKIGAKFRMTNLKAIYCLPRSDRENTWFNQIVRYMEDEYEGNLTRPVGKDRERIIIETLMSKKIHKIDYDDLEDDQAEKEQKKPWWK